MNQNRIFPLLSIILLFSVAFPVALFSDGYIHPQSKDIIIENSAPDIEEIWAIEDSRTESGTPLVTYLENHHSPLGYDSQTNTFFCTLGMDTGSEWPDIELKIPDPPPEISVQFVDDYTYDWCDQAIEEGISYELIAYTDTEYSYFNLVFTGLPIVSLYTEQTIDTEYVPAYASVSSSQHAPVSSLARTHLRGAITLREEKSSYRLELHRINQTGKDKKNKVSLLDMPADSDWLLCANPLDFTVLRNHLAWNLWKAWNSDDQAFSLLESRMVELFVNNEYRGLYQLMQRVDTDREIMLMGGNLETDCAFRVIMPANAKNHAFRDYKATADVHLELRKPPQNMSEEIAFQIVNPYIELADMKMGLLNNESFLRQFEQHMDVEDVISYYLFSQAISLSEDNVYNNLYIWALKDKDGYHFTFAPWDMDRAFTPVEAEMRDTPMSGTDSMCLELRIPVRLLNLNGLNSRQILWSIWKEKRNTIISDAAIYQMFYDAADLVNLSGAYARNAEKWTGQAHMLNVTEICNYALQHLNTVDRYLRECWPYGEYIPDGKSVIEIQ